MTEKKYQDAVGHKRPRNETIVFRDGKPHSTKKRKITAAAKKRTNLHEARKTKLPAQDAPLESGKFWTLRVGPREIISVVPKCVLAIRNNGPDPVRVSSYGDQQELMPGEILEILAYKKVTIADKGFKSALVEMQVITTCF
jgi:hypothetical protein